MAKNGFSHLAEAMEVALKASPTFAKKMAVARAKADLARARAKLNKARRNEDAGRLASAVKSASKKASTPQPTESPKALVSVVEAVVPSTQNKGKRGKAAPTPKKGVATPKRQKPAASAHVAVPRNGEVVCGVWFADVKSFAAVVAKAGLIKAQKVHGLKPVAVAGAKVLANILGKSTYRAPHIERPILSLAAALREEAEMTSWLMRYC